jgi:Co/Zn/Cd efflux system component
MHAHRLCDWRHDHSFLGEAHDRNERRTWAVVALTTTMMLAEIAGGTIFGSMALLADGWHMSTHAGALAIAAGAYRYARQRLGPGHHGAIVSLVSDAPQPVEAYKARLADVEHLSHLTVEVHQCAGAH